MRRTSIFIGLLSALTFMACKNDKANQQIELDKENVAKEEIQASTENLKLNFKTDEQYNVAHLYFDLKDALVKSDAYSAKKIAEIMVKYFKNEKQIKLAQQIINNENDIETQREAFYALSQNFDTIFSENITAGKLYKQYCPMAFNNEGGFWFSEEKEIMNPYFGDKMLHCGSIQGTIK